MNIVDSRKLHAHGFFGLGQKKVEILNPDLRKNKMLDHDRGLGELKAPYEIIISFYFNFVVTNIFIINLLCKREKFVCEQKFDSSLRKKNHRKVL